MSAEVEARRSLTSVRIDGDQNMSGDSVHSTVLLGFVSAAHIVEERGLVEMAQEGVVRLPVLHLHVGREDEIRFDVTRLAPLLHLDGHEPLVGVGGDDSAALVACVRIFEDPHILALGSRHRHCHAPSRVGCWPATRQRGEQQRVREAAAGGGSKRRT